MTTRLFFVVCALTLAACSTKPAQPCGPSTCAGCCAFDGTCQVPSVAACGAFGNACTPCLGNQICNLGACITTGAQGGGSTSTGGGGGTNTGGGANTGGGTSTGGGAGDAGVIQLSWENPLPQGHDLNAVWSNGTDSWAVGDVGTIMRALGGGWVTVPSGTTEDLLGVYGFSANDVWAVGQLVILHWDGSTWSTVAFPSSQTLNDVWGTSSNDLWVVGINRAFHWNGSTWSTHVVGNNSSLGLTAVWGSASNDVWTVGQVFATRAAQAFHWNGTAWTESTIPAIERLEHLWGSGPSDVWAAGHYGVLHWNGTSWVTSLNTDASPFLGHWFQGIWGTSATNLYAVGSNVRRFNGSWTTVAELNEPLNAISRDWAVGRAGTIARVSTWADVTSGPRAYVEALWAVAPNDVWAVGAAPQDSFAGAILHWDGSAWTIAFDSADRFTSIWGSAANDLWAVDDAGGIFRWNGTQWLKVPSTTQSRLNSVSGSAANNVWAVGTNGTIVRWNGSAWAIVPSGSTLTLNGVHVISANDVWAVGEQGTVLHWNGTSWAPSTSGTTSSLESVWAASATDVWAVGGTTILRWNGTAWTQTRNADSITSVWGRAPNDVWLATSKGAQWWNGSTWTRSEVRGWCQAVGGVGSNVWVGGEAGKILRAR